MNHNHLSKLQYQGQNQVNLERVRLNKGYQSDGWVTFYEATRIMGKKIRKGEKGTAVFRGFGEFTEKDENGKLKTITKPLGYHYVFNLDQLEDRKEQ